MSVEIKLKKKVKEDNESEPLSSADQKEEICDLDKINKTICCSKFELFYLFLNEKTLFIFDTYCRGRPKLLQRDKDGSASRPALFYRTICVAGFSDLEKHWICQGVNQSKRTDGGDQWW